MHKYRLALFPILVSLSLLTSCGSGGGTVMPSSTPSNIPSNSGNDSSGTSSGNSGRSDKSVNVIAVASLVALAAYQMWKRTPNISEQAATAIPSLKFERPNDGKLTNGPAGYVLFTTLSGGQNINRHIRFCKELIDRFSMPNTVEMVWGQKYPRQFTIWPLRNTNVIDTTDCRSLVQLYDDRYYRQIMLKYRIPAGRGPLLIAFPRPLNDTQSSGKGPVGVYWDGSEYEDNDLAVIIQKWHDIMSHPPETWEMRVQELGNTERIRRTLKFFN